PAERDAGEVPPPSGDLPDTRLPPAPAPAELPAGTLIGSGPLADITLPTEDPLTRTQLDGWNRALQRLGRDSTSRLLRGLKSVRDGKPLAAGEGAEDAELAPWREMLDRLDAAWTRFHDDALTSLAEDAAGLNAEQREQWLAVLQRSRSTWQQQFLPALQAAATPDGPTLEQVVELSRMQSLLDQVALRRVEDNTVLRAAESDAWFRLLEQLAAAEPQALTQASTGAVGYLQLYKQPDVYRGKLVTVRGQARLAYRVQAPENIYGIDAYYIFWVKPAGGPDLPLVVYSLELPPGFPQVQAKAVDQAANRLNEDVEFTGYFFKRWAYAAQNGANTAPLLLARAPRWYPRTGLVARSVELPSLAATLAIVAVGLGVALALTAAVFLSRRRAAADWRPGATPRESSPQFEHLAHGDHPTRIEATLRTLADDQPGESRDGGR
ncbi:MAG: hypothetical protein J5I93_15520, partial [Pirellulaceae bacterium]|nr:hypothetical protein [Pirellulaceae bacterium]